ncbi:magnesium transporter CorA family protein [Candidatus Solirubrobacter pratensis]|uniref:magnesium transporter CorA family protein n=1 Tax=Candidatus Solirubrobacter pratensis TaxID=1298857 RepID=UPI000407DADE|nr:magnesium transporter CorA family protein [Candidatus Solirubrobacter pratensis]
MLVLTAVDEARIRAQRERDEFFWLDLLSPSDDDLGKLGDLLELHPVAMEDTREFGQRPKIDLYEHHLLLVFYSARVTGDPDSPARPIEVHVYLSGGFVVTVRREPCLVLDQLHESLQPESTKEEEVLVYRILDGLTDAFYPVIDRIEEEVDALEADVLARPRREYLSRIYRLKQAVHGLQRLVSVQKEQFHRSSDEILNLAGLSHGSRAYLRDVGDHLAQVAGELQRQTDDLMALTSTYFNANSDRLNAVATRLTIGTTLFVAWTLVTGFFGQNFGWLVDHIRSRGSFITFGVGGLVVPTIVLLTLFYVKRDDWF